MWLWRFGFILEPIFATALTTLKNGQNRLMSYLEVGWVFLGILKAGNFLTLEF